MKKFILNLVFVLAIVNLYAQQKVAQADTATSVHGHPEREIKGLKESVQYDLVDLCENGFVRAKGTGQSITNINATVENLTRKKIKVVVKPGTYFVAGDGYQNMVTRKEYAFVLNPLSKKRVNIEASCINAGLEIPGENEKFSGVSKVPDDLKRFLEACRNCNAMVVQAGAWAITDDFTGEDVQEHLERSINGIPMGSAVSDNDIAEARKILKRLGIKTSL